MYSKMTATIFSTVLLFFLILPIKENFKKKPKDNFPFSYYPMFAIKRDSVYAINYFVGYDFTGNRHLIHYNYIGSGGFNQVRRQLNKTCKSGETNKISQHVADKLRKCQEAPLSNLVRVDLVKGTYHLENYFSLSQRQPISEEILNSKTIKNHKKL